MSSSALKSSESLSVELSSSMSSVKFPIPNVSRDFFEVFLYPFLFPCYLSDCTNTWLSSRHIDHETSFVDFAVIWFSESRLNFSNLALYAGRSLLASIDSRIAPVLQWRKEYTDKSQWSDWHHTILSCPCITSKLCAKVELVGLLKIEIPLSVTNDIHGPIK